MSRSRVRRAIAACALPAAMAAALIGPGAAAATPPGEQCAGVNIEGKGASLQELAQIKLWNPEFNKSASALACSGTQGSTGKPTVKYASVGSGAGLKSWGQESAKTEEINFGAKNAYIGTDEPPNQAQKEEIEKHSSLFKAKESKLLETIPVLQAAVAVIIHLPSGCTSVEGGPAGNPAPGRIAIKETILQKVFAGEDVQWKQVLNKAKLLPKNCNAATKAEKEAGKPEKELIKRVVREDGSGTTSIFKKFLNVIRKGKEAGGSGKTWKELAESANNTVWPKEAEDPVLKAAKGSGVAKKVSETASTIGYANVADARVNGEFTEETAGGGPGKPRFWAVVQNNKTTYTDPATNGPAKAKANSNCAETVYSNGKKAFPPKSANEPWNEVTTEVKETNYVICGFTYDLSLDHFLSFKSEAPNPEPEAGEARAAFDYLNFVLDPTAGGGQALIGSGQDYLDLPKAIRTIAQEGQARIND